MNNFKFRLIWLPQIFSFSTKKFIFSLRCRWVGVYKSWEQHLYQWTRIPNTAWCQGCLLYGDGLYGCIGRKVWIHHEYLFCLLQWFGNGCEHRFMCSQEDHIQRYVISFTCTDCGKIQITFNTRETLTQKWWYSVLHVASIWQRVHQIPKWNRLPRC